MRFLLALPLIVLAACATPRQGFFHPDDVGSVVGSPFAGAALDAPAENDDIVCPGEFPGSTSFEDSREGVGSFFCDD